MVNTSMTYIFPGSFDPFTKGHFELVKRISKFGNVVILLSSNSSKKNMFSVHQRKHIIELSIADLENVSVDVLKENVPTVTYAKMHNGILVRGLRSSIDFQYEQNIDWVNKNIENKVETLYIMSNPNDVVFSSSNVRELVKLNLNISKFLCNEKAEEYINSIYHHMIAG